MHDAFNETINRLVDSGMDEYDAIALITELLEQEARDFINFDDEFNSISLFRKPNELVN